MLKAKLTIVGIILIIIAANPFQAQAATQFSDVNSHWAKKEIMYLSDLNIIGGYPDGTFNPNEPITRSQASAMLIKALKIPLNEDTSIQFKDVAKDSPYYKILATVNEKGILRGNNGFMRPGEETSRAQMAAILRRAFDMPLDKQPTFIDVTPAHWAYQDINGIAKQRVAGGSNGKFMPKDAVTRAQFSAFLVRAMDDKMKLSNYRSYVSIKGKAIEQDGLLYSIAKDKDGYNQIIKENMETAKQEVLLKDEDIPRSPWDYSPLYLHNNTQLILYNNEIFIPYYSGDFAEADEVPYAYAVMKMNTNGQELKKMKEPSGSNFRNMFVWNDRIFYTDVDAENWNYLNRRIVQDNEKFVDSKLELYSTKMDGSSDKKKECSFDARITFDVYSYSYGDGTPIEAGGENKSVLYDHSSIYYFNNKGIFKYSLLDKTTNKLSNVLAKDMNISDTQLVVTDLNGKKHTLKK